MSTVIATAADAIRTTKPMLIMAAADLSLLAAARVIEVVAG
ncbi:hypothetical protein V6N00_12450 [Tersicoccus sp. MR15.9]